MTKITDAQKTDIMLQALQKYYGGWHRMRTNVLFPELRLGSGYSDIAQRRIDLFIISSEKGNYTTAFEIKASRTDFLKDIKNDLKQRGARMYATNFYYVAPKGMLKAEEIPVWAGLKEYDFETERFNTPIPAPLQSRNNPSWGLICSLVRRINQNLYYEEIKEITAERNYWKKECEKQRALLERLANAEVTDKDLLKLAYQQYKTTKGAM